MTGTQELYRDPDSEFGDPAELLDRDDLSKQEKLQILRSWYADLVEDQKATEENMSDTSNESGTTGARLMQVVAAINRLERQGREPR